MAVSTALAKIYRNTDLAPHRGLLPEVGDTLLGMGAAYALGELHGRYPDKMTVWGHDVSLVGGVGAKLASIAGQAFGGHYGSMLAPHLSTIANASLNCYAFAHGVSSGTNAKGSAMMTQLPAKGATKVGEIPAAPPGTFLRPDEIEHFARSR